MTTEVKITNLGPDTIKVSVLNKLEDISSCSNFTILQQDEEVSEYVYDTQTLFINENIIEV